MPKSSLRTSVIASFILALSSIAPWGYQYLPAQSPGKQTTDSHAGHDHTSQEMDRSSGLSPDAANIPDEDQSPLAQEYRAAFAELRQFLKSSRKVYVEYYVARKDEPEKYLLRWLAVASEGHQKMAKVRSAMINLFRANSGRYQALGDALFQIAMKDEEEDRPESALEIYEALIEIGYDDPTLYERASRAAFASNQFEKVSVYLRESSSLGRNVPPELLNSFDMMSQQWQQELSMRRKEEQEDTLPRVELITTKGIIEIELFEDDYPETIANFIYLVENGYYNAKPLFRVEPHNIAQTGCERGDGSGTPGYTIRGEHASGRARGHYRGSLGMALSIDETTKKADPNSGSGQFYFCLAPQPQNDGQYLVFGRITRGMEALGFFNRIDMTQKEQRNSGDSADSVVRARVIRKRDHEYKPIPHSGRLMY